MISATTTSPQALSPALTNADLSGMQEPLQNLTERFDGYSDERLSEEKCQTTFSSALYREHLEEASFLYGQRWALLDDPECSWRDLHEFENRFEAHIDALYIGKKRALAVCIERTMIAKPDPGELHATVRVLCRNRQPEMFWTISKSIDPSDEQAVCAIKYALAEEVPDDWLDDLAKWFVDNQPIFCNMVPYIFGYRRSTSEKICSSLEVSPANLEERAWCAGRIGNNVDWLVARLDSGVGDNERSSVARTLLRRRNYKCVPLLKTNHATAGWSLLLLGISGSRLDLGFMHSMYATSPSGDALIALGLLGCSVSMNLLIQTLENESLAEAASQALYLISGAPLFEEVRLVEMDDTESPAIVRCGRNIQRISQQKKHWELWCNTHASEFKMNVRYRHGRPFDLQCIIETIASDFLPRRIRQLAYEELLIRYAIDIPFETEMTVVWQDFSLDYLRRIAVNRIHEFDAGQWYRGGAVYYGDDE